MVGKCIWQLFEAKPGWTPIDSDRFSLKSECHFSGSWLLAMSECGLVHRYASHEFWNLDRS
jgi:hypothetical protein